MSYISNLIRFKSMSSPVCFHEFAMLGSFKSPPQIFLINESEVRD